ncbi:MAG: site-specific integrase [Bacteriovoracaceae bacterium]|nr:site-specific integrase [Bacteriovoracaceae bacterium]
MQEFKVNIFTSQENNFLTSFVDPLTKRKVRRCFSTKEDAQVFKKSTETMYKVGPKNKFSNLTIEELIIYFLIEKPKYNKFSKTHCHLIDFIDTFGKFYVENITHNSLKMWLDQIQAENNLKDITMRHIKGDVDSLFTFLEEKEIISESPLRRIYYDQIAPPLKARNLLSESDIKKLLNSIKLYSPGYLYPIIKMFAETGMKTSELVELRWDEINLDNGIVRLNTKLQCQDRTLKISSELVKILSMKKRVSEIVFQTYYKEPFTNFKLVRIINEFKAKKMYIGEWCPMDLRHSFAVIFLSNGGDILELQRILGHKSVYDTKRLYAEAVGKKITNDIINPFE